MKYGRSKKATQFPSRGQGGHSHRSGSTGSLKTQNQILHPINLGDARFSHPIPAHTRITMPKRWRRSSIPTRDDSPLELAPPPRKRPLPRILFPAKIAQVGARSPQRSPRTTVVKQGRSKTGCACFSRGAEPHCRCRQCQPGEVRPSRRHVCAAVPATMWG